jgi:hypothetical protein
MESNIFTKFSIKFCWLTRSRTIGPFIRPLSTFLTSSQRFSYHYIGISLTGISNPTLIDSKPLTPINVVNITDFFYINWWVFTVNDLIFRTRDYWYANRPFALPLTVWVTREFVSEFVKDNSNLISNLNNLLINLNCKRVSLIHTINLRLYFKKLKFSLNFF